MGGLGVEEGSGLCSRKGGLALHWHWGIDQPSAAHAIAVAVYACMACASAPPKSDPRRPPAHGACTQYAAKAAPPGAVSHSHPHSHPPCACLRASIQAHAPSVKSCRYTPTASFSTWGSWMGSGVKVTKNLLVLAKKRPAHQFALLVGKCPGGSWRGPEAPTCPGRIVGAEQVKPQRAGPESADPAAPPPPPRPQPTLAAAQPRPAPGGGVPRGSKHGAGVRMISVHARPQQAAQQEGPVRDRLGRLLVPLPRPEGQGTSKQGSRRVKKAGAGGAEGNPEEAGAR